MVTKKIAIIERNKERGELLCAYLKARNFEVTLLDKIESIEKTQEFLGKEKFNLFLIDVIPQEALSIGEIDEISSEFCLSLSQALKNNPKFQDTVIVFLSMKNDIPQIARAIEAGADNILTQESHAVCLPEDTLYFFDKIAFKEKRVLDLNLINFLLQINAQSKREDFFILVPAIFNHLFLNKIRPIIGETVIGNIVCRLESLISPEHNFMAKIKFREGQVFMDEVDTASKEISVQQLSVAFRDYFYAFIHLVRTLTSDILVERWEWKRI